MEDEAFLPSQTSASNLKPSSRDHPSHLPKAFLGSFFYSLTHSLEERRKFIVFLLNKEEKGEMKGEEVGKEREGKGKRKKNKDKTSL